MEQEKWIHDIQAGELVNLRDCKAVWVHRDRDESDDYSAQYSLCLSYYRDKSEFYLHYETKELLYNAFEHYKKLLKCEDLDVSQKPVTL